MVTNPKTPDKDAMLEGGQADYGSAGGQAAEGVNGAKPDAETDADDTDAAEDDAAAKI